MFLESLLNYLHSKGNVAMPGYIVSTIKGSMKRELHLWQDAFQRWLNNGLQSKWPLSPHLRPDVSLPHDSGGQARSHRASEFNSSNLSTGYCFQNRSVSIDLSVFKYSQKIISGGQGENPPKRITQQFKKFYKFFEQYVYIWSEFWKQEVRTASLKVQNDSKPNLKMRVKIRNMVCMFCF